MGLNQVDTHGPDRPGNFSKADVHVVLNHLPEPIDLGLDPVSNTLYWTDHGDLPFGDSVNVFNLDAVFKGENGLRILVQCLRDGFGMPSGLEYGLMFFGDLMGGVYVSRWDGRENRTLFTDLGILPALSTLIATCRSV
jgi:hypothetical protein